MNPYAIPCTLVWGRLRVVDLEIGFVFKALFGPIAIQRLGASGTWPKILFSHGTQNLELKIGGPLKLGTTVTRMQLESASQL